MKNFHLLLTLLAGITLGLAQDRGSSEADQLPVCAQLCLHTALQQTTCDVANKTCLCTNTDLNNILTDCVQQYCTIKESLITKNLTETSCNVPIRSRSTHTRNTNIILCIISVACVLARIAYKGFFCIDELGADDYAVLLALVVGIPQDIVIDRVIIPNGLGRDVWTLPFEDITAFIRGLYSLMIAYFLQIMLVKLSLLLFFLRIFPRSMTRKLVWATIVVVVLFGLSFSLAGTFTCWPINTFWKHWYKEDAEECINLNAMSWINAGLNIGLDVWMLALPLYEVSRLQLSWRRKLGASFMFFVGTFVTIVSIMRLRFLVYFKPSSNPTWTQTKLIFATILEVNVGIICVCLPSLRVILVHMFPQLHASSHAVSQRKYSQAGIGGRTDETVSVTDSPLSSRYSNAILLTHAVEIQHDDVDKTKNLQMKDLEIGSPNSLQSSKKGPGSEMSM